MTTYYPSCSQSVKSIADALEEIGVDSSFSNREKIAEINGISNYKGKQEENVELLNKLKKGELIKSKDSIKAEDTKVNSKSFEQALKNIETSGEFDKKTHAMVIIGNLLYKNGYETGFIAGLLANIYHEGNFGFFESSKYTSNPSAKPKYLAIMDESYEYSTKYSGKCVTDVSLKELKTLCDKLKNDGWKKGAFGLGVIQWTYERTYTLITYYLEEANNGDKISLDQVISAEGKLIIKELKSQQYKKIYENWRNENKNLDCEEAAYNAASKICLKYEIPDDKEAQAQKRGKTAKKVYKIMTSQ